MACMYSQYMESPDRTITPMISGIRLGESRRDYYGYGDSSMVPYPRDLELKVDPETLGSGMGGLYCTPNSMIDSHHPHHSLMPHHHDSSPSSQSSSGGGGSANGQNRNRKNKEEKICGVCGDKALGFNFDAISCESCKAFFRRNAPKGLGYFKCPYDEKCKMDLSNRRFCKRCRLKKCFEIGMRKEYILSEEEKAQKRQKIEDNRFLRRTCSNMTTPKHQPQISNSANSSSNKHQHNSPNNNINSSSVNSSHNNAIGGNNNNAHGMSNSSYNHLSSHHHLPHHLAPHLPHQLHHHHQSLPLLPPLPPHPSLSSGPLQMPTHHLSRPTSSIEHNILRPPRLDYEPHHSHPSPAPLIPPPPPSISHHSYNHPLSLLPPHLHFPPSTPLHPHATSLSIEDSSVIYDLHLAYTNSLEVNIERDVSRNDANFSDLVNIAELSVRRVIAMAKQVSAFKMLPQVEQIHLLKGGSIELLILRSVITFDKEKQHFLDPVDHEETKAMKLEQLEKAENGTGLFEDHMHFVRSLAFDLNADDTTLILLLVISLFSPDRDNLENRKLVAAEQEKYSRILQCYLESLYPVAMARSMFPRLLLKLTDIRNLNEEHSQVLLKVKPEGIQPLMKEVLDLSC